MKIYRLGKLSNMFSTTLFHAMAEFGYEGLILCEPEDTYVSLGYFDKAEELIDLKRCKELDIGVIRRQTGGGAVLLAPGQVFYQLLLSKSKVPFKVEDAYRKLSQPVIRAYRRLGVEVEYKPINDLVVKEVSDEELAQFLGEDPERLKEDLQAISFSYLMSLEEIFFEGRSYEELFESKEESPEEVVIKKDLREKLLKAIERLEEKEKLVLQLLYYEELPLKEVAKLLGVSMARISQIKSSAIEKLKSYLASAL